jgi:hypothetical protein
LANPELNQPSLDERPEGAAEQASSIGCIVRLAWFATNCALVVIAALILREHPGPLSPLSAVYWGDVALCSALHYLEVKAFSGATMSGKPASVSTWRIYSLKLLAVAAAIWVAALLLG